MAAAPIVSVVGKSNVGKTTLLEKVRLLGRLVLLSFYLSILPIPAILSVL